VDLSVCKDVIADVYWTPVNRMSEPLTVHVKGFGSGLVTSLPQLYRKVLSAVIVTVYSIVNFNWAFAGMSPKGSIMNVYLLGSKTLPEVVATVKV
jgi:hypothetical protein